MKHVDILHINLVGQTEPSTGKLQTMMYQSWIGSQEPDIVFYGVSDIPGSQFSEKIPATLAKLTGYLLQTHHFLVAKSGFFEPPNQNNLKLRGA